jgi:microcystin-dependent protein
MLIAGTPYTMRFAAGDHVFYLKNFYGPQLYVVPVGGLLPYIAGAGGVVPNSAFAFPAGQAISRATYSVLFSLIGGVYGAGDGSTTFNLPDLRGRAIFGLDNMGGTNANRITNVIYNGSAIGSAGGEQMHALSAAEMPNHNHSANSYDSGHQHGMGFTGLAGGGGGGAVPNIPPYNQNWSTDIGYAAITTDIGYAGNSYAHNNMPPSMVLNYILRVI